VEEENAKGGWGGGSNKAADVRRGVVFRHHRDPLEKKMTRNILGHLLRAGKRVNLGETSRGAAGLTSVRRKGKGESQRSTSASKSDVAGN